ncbi:DUF3157 family protein [Photobacterium leiognathi subsp. mandapamensis]|uniref:DUF3157 family protein n=1 Tax=Photobacterium leiognathi TaxID=553611 RepID=UPI003BF61DD0
MKTTTKLGLLFVAITSAHPVWAADQTVTLEDGRQVVLHDDFTWSYSQQPDVALSANSTTTKPATTVEAIPVKSDLNTQSAIPVITVAKVSLTSPKNIQQISDSGVDILLQAPRYEDGELFIPTMMTNQGSKSVMSVALRVTLNDADNQKLESKDVVLWRSIKRMPDTYFRAKTQEHGKDIIFSVPKMDNYTIQAEVIDIELW